MPQLYQYTEKKTPFVTQILKALKERQDVSVIQDILQSGVSVQTPRSTDHVPEDLNQLKIIHKEGYPFSATALASRCQTDPGSLWKGVDRLLPLSPWR